MAWKNNGFYLIYGLMIGAQETKHIFIQFFKICNCDLNVINQF